MATKHAPEPRGIVATILRAQSLIAIGFFAGLAAFGFIRGLYLGWFGFPGC